jgi:hypothetical protein
VYKRSISKILHEHRLAGMLVTFRGPRAGGKSHSLVGSLADPGMLPVLMLELMQEKYSRASRDMKVIVSFLEFREERVIDLLSHTSIPLQFWNKGSVYPLSSFEINEFLEFLRLFKVALFFNRSRDIAMPNFRNSQLPNHFITRVKILRREGASFDKTEVMFVDFAEERDTDPDLGLRSSEKAYLSVLREMQAACSNQGKKGYVNFEASRLTELLRPYLLNGSVNNYTCICESEDLQLLESELNKIDQVNNIGVRNESCEQELAETRLEGLLGQALDQLDRTQQDILTLQFSKFRELAA